MAGYGGGYGWNVIVVGLKTDNMLGCAVLVSEQS